MAHDLGARRHAEQAVQVVPVAPLEDLPRLHHLLRALLGIHLGRTRAKLGMSIGYACKCKHRYEGM